MSDSRFFWKLFIILLFTAAILVGTAFISRAMYEAIALNCHPKQHGRYACKPGWDK